MVIREIERAGSGYEVLGCVDDDPSKQGIRIQGTSVIGRVDEIGALLARYPADERVLAASFIYARPRNARFTTA